MKRKVESPKIGKDDERHPAPPPNSLLHSKAPYLLSPIGHVTSVHRFTGIQFHHQHLHRTSQEGLQVQGQPG